VNNQGCTLGDNACEDRPDKPGGSQVSWFGSLFRTFRNWMRHTPVLRTIIRQAPELKSMREIGLMRESGKVVARALRLCREMCKPGVHTLEVDRAVDALFARHGATPLFKGYPGARVPFPASTCISLNEQVVHGIPGQRQIRDGDLVKIDTACKLNGWCADAAITIIVGNVRPEWRRLVETCEQVLQIAIEEMGRRRWWSEVALRMQQHTEAAGFSLVQNYVGHGIGRIMHENPQVPNFVSREFKKHDFRLEEGLVLAVEPMLNMGRQETYTLRDHWTVVTKDGMPSVHMEHTVAITSNGIMVLTADEDQPPSPTATQPVATQVAKPVKCVESVGVPGVS
jgi:methionyl aminopeptidase